MSGFSPHWLALREPFDAAARATDLADAFLEAVAPDGLVVDLGAGAGSNIAFLRERKRLLRWRHVDADPTLIAVARSRFAGDRSIGFVMLDLARDLAATLDGVNAVTCAALLDLVSAHWIEQLALALATHRLPALIALTYDGRMRWSPAHRDDDRIAAAFHADMARDKGFGPALGPAATQFFISRLREAGALVELRSSDWQIGTGDCAVLQEMITGVAGAAARGEPARVATWSEDRHARLARRSLALEVGHQDLLVRWA